MKNNLSSNNLYFPNFITKDIKHSFLNSNMHNSILRFKILSNLLKNNEIFIFFNVNISLIIIYLLMKFIFSTKVIHKFRLLVYPEGAFSSRKNINFI